MTDTELTLEELGAISARFHSARFTENFSIEPNAMTKLLAAARKHIEAAGAELRVADLMRQAAAALKTLKNERDAATTALNAAMQGGLLCPISERDSLSKKVERLEGALRFYAHNDAMDPSYGETARAALAEEDG